MTRSVTALVNPNLLKWARETAAMTVFLAAEKIKVKSERLEEWENGVSLPTFKQLLTISKIYKRPLSIFYLSHPPKDFKPLQDYRLLPDTVPSLDESPQLNLEIRKAYYRRQVAIDLVKLLGESVPTLHYTVTFTQDSEEIGEALRKLLKISLKDQISWETDYEALNGWRSALENLGVLIFQAEKIAVSEMRGFAISESPLPTIVVNKKDSPKGRIFSMLHELTHVLMGDSSVSGDEQNTIVGWSTKEQKIEMFCNSVAGATLLPLSAFYEDPELASYEYNNEWNDSNVMNIASRFNVSRECVWRRLLARKKITSQTYQKKRSELLNEFRRKKIVTPKGGPKYHIKVLSSIGKLYPEIILNSYHRQKITASDLSEYLGVKLKHVQKIESVLFGAA